MKQTYDNFKLQCMIKEMHKHTARHVLVLEADLRQEDKVFIFGYSERLRLLHNEMARTMNNRYGQLIRTKKYRKLLNEYKKCCTEHNKVKKEEIGAQIRKMRFDYGVSNEDCRLLAKSLYSKFNVLAVFACTVAENIWIGLEKILFEGGEVLGYKKRFNLPSIRSKQRQRGVVIKSVDGKLQFALGNLKFNALPGDRFQTEEIEKVLEYFSDMKNIDETAAILWKEKGIISDTFRPCFVTLHPVVIRGKLRVFIHLNLEGKPLPKYDRNGNIKHKLGKGTIGIDIGTQTIAYTSDNGMGLNNLAERYNTLIGLEKKMHGIQRSMDRSRKALNPDNYDENGVCKKGACKWVFSKHYRKNRRKLRELHRVAAINRRLAINEQVNVVRSLGDIAVTENSNARSLMVKAKEVTWNEEKGRHNRRKRFGRSIQKRCPGMMHATIKKKFECTGGKFIIVPQDYKASQYDCKSKEYVKKGLGQRMFSLSDGTIVQRDLYSSFLLWCINSDEKTIDGELCVERFDNYFERQNRLIDEIIDDRRVIMNSGIKV